MIYMPKKRLQRTINTAALAGFVAGKEAAIKIVQATMGSVPQALIDAIRAVQAEGLPGEKKNKVAPEVDRQKPARPVKRDTPCPLAKPDEEGGPHRIGTLGSCAGCNLHNAKIKAGKVIVIE